MTPEDDPYWPKCQHGVKHWCDTVSQMMSTNGDSIHIEPGVPICVPVFPSLELYAHVTVDTDEVVPNFCHTLWLVLDSDLDPFNIGNATIATENIGLWTVGEGRIAMASTIMDWTEAFGMDHICTGPRHGFREEMLIKQREEMQDQTWIRANQFAIRYLKHCIPCDNATKPEFGAPSSTFTGTDFGMGEVTNKTTSPRASSTMDLLRQRHGQP